MKQLFLLLFLFSIAALFSQNKPYPNSQFLTIDNITLHYRQWKPSVVPKGQILLIAGFCGSSFTWRNNIDTLVQEGYEVTTIDIPPFGYSEKAKHINRSTSFNAALAWKLAHQVGDTTQKWILMGHSMGGDIVKYMYFLEPEQVKSIVFADPAFCVFYNPSWLRQKLLGTNSAYQMGEYLGTHYFLKPKMANLILTLAYSKEADSSTLHTYIKELNQKGVSGGIIDILASKQPYRFKKQVIRVPCLQIWGKRDHIISFLLSKPYLKCLPKDTPIERIKKAGHCPGETHPAIFNNLVITFLQKNQS